MTEKRFQIIHLGNPYEFVVKDHQTNKTYGTLQGDDKSLMELLNELNEENMNLRAKHTQMIIILKDVVNDLKRMDTYRYAEHLEKIANLHFLSEKEFEE